MENENKNTTEVNNETTEATEVLENKEIKSNKKRCPNCQALVVETQAFCPECGTSLKKACDKCGMELIEGQAFCSKCGAKVAGTQLIDSPSSLNQFNNNVANQQNKKKNIPIIAACAGVAIVAVVLYFTKFGVGMDFNKEFKNIANETWCEIASDGSFMYIDTNPFDIEDDNEADAIEAIEQINKKLGFSDSVYQKMMQTRSLDGRVSEENDKYEISWTFHPDIGMEVMYEKK